MRWNFHVRPPGIPVRVHHLRMEALRIALGLVKEKGQEVVPPRIMAFGAEESNFLTRHVQKVREQRDGRARSRFTGDSQVPHLLKRLLIARGEEFNEVAAVLQRRLADAMRGSTNAKDCVFGVIVTGSGDSADHVTLLKLDAVLDAAQTSINEGRVSLKVLKKLVPEPGKLQKALSWPDEIDVSDVIILDRNTTLAAYFENAYDVRVSERSRAAESRLERLILEHLPREQAGAALVDASRMSGPMDVVLSELGRTYPDMTDVAAVQARSAHPPGIIRRDKVGATLVYRADGAELRVPAGRRTAVSITRETDGDGWVLAFRSRCEPALEASAGSRPG